MNNFIVDTHFSHIRALFLSAVGTLDRNSAAKLQSCIGMP